MENIRLIRNKDHGVDLMLTEGTNNVHIQTSNKENSLKFWNDLKAKADEAIALLKKAEQPVHVIIIGNPGKGTVSHTKTYRRK